MSDPPNVFGKMLRELREAAGLRIADAARLVGCTWSQWSKWEKGEYVPKGARLNQVLAAMSPAAILQPLKVGAPGASRRAM